MSLKYKWAKLTHDPTTGFTGLSTTDEMVRRTVNGRQRWESRKRWKCHICGTVEETDRHGVPTDWAERWITPHHPLVVCGGCRHKEGIG